MIVNSVKNILAGFGTASIKGGTISASGAPSGSPLALSARFNFPTGMAPIVCGYTKVRITAMNGGTWIAVNVYASPASLSPATVIGTAEQQYALINVAFEGDFIFPFMADYGLASFTAAVVFQAGTTGATVDFEVWGAAMAGGQ